MNTLSIHVSELVRVIDQIGNALAFLIKTFVNLFSGDVRPAITEPTKEDGNKSPPDLGVSVDDSLSTGEALG
jgi:hypothetical protein